MGVYYSVAVRRIRPHFGCGIRFSQNNQCGIRFLYCYAVAENWHLNERFTVFAYFVEPSTTRCRKKNATDF